MSQLDLQKELEALKQKISSLEEKVNDKKQNIGLFGRSYSQTGSSDSDFIIKTKGQVKIQWGNKFIDLIKDGKINVDSKFIFSVNSKDDIGQKNGIYVTKEGLVYLKYNDTLINLVGEVGTAYVSFMGEQDTTSEQKTTALKNIGFLYDTLEAVDESAVQNGIVYVTSEQKLYTITDGVVSEFTFQFPNPFTQQFIIQKNDDSQGALVIKGSGINNSLAFDSLYIYTEEGQSYFQSLSDVHLKIDEEEVITVTGNKTTFNTKIESDFIQSKDADNESGFRLYVDEDGSTLEVDNLIVRNKTDDISTLIFPNFWSYQNNVITKVDETYDEELGVVYILTLDYENKYKVDDKLYMYGKVKVDDFRYKLVKIPVIILAIDTETNNNIYVQIIPGIEVEADELTEIPDLVGQITFQASTDKEFSQLRYSEQNVDLLQYSQIEDEPEKESVKHRVGNIEELELKGKDKKEEIPIEGIGSYSENAAFLKAQYTSKYDLPYDDNSTKLVSTEWIHNLFPKGTIIMFNGNSADIPKGWAICDGTNGTPNLIDKFIKASTSVYESTDSDSQDYPVVLNSSNTPTSDHTHTITIPGSFVTVSIPAHNHALKYVKVSKRKRVETGDGELAKDVHFAGVGSIYKGAEQWDAKTGTGGIVVSSEFDGRDIVSSESLEGTAYISSSTTTSDSATSSGGSNTLEIKLPRYYALIFIMKIV